MVQKDFVIFALLLQRSDPAFFNLDPDVQYEIAKQAFQKWSDDSNTTNETEHMHAWIMTKYNDWVKSRGFVYYSSEIKKG